MKLRAHVLAACIAATLVVSLPAGAASSPDAVNLVEVYQRALQNDPVLREAEANRLATLESKPQARAGLLPQLTASGQWDQADSEAERSQVNLAANNQLTLVTSNTASNDVTSRSWNIRLTQTLFRWDRWAALNRADKQVAQAEVDFKAAQQDLLARTAARYFDVLAAQDTLDAAQATLDAFSRQLEQAEKRFEVGLIAITDVQESRAARDQASAAVIAAKRTLATNREFLRELTGETFGNLAQPGDDMPLRTPEPASEDDWVKAALDQNLNLISARLATEIAKEDIAVARAGHLPTIDLFAQRSRDKDAGNDSIVRRSNGDVIPNINDGMANSDMVGVQVTVPIYSGGATQSQVRQRVYQHRAARERSERTARETERLARDAYLGVLSEMSRVQALRQAVASSQTALQATEAGFEVGTRTTVDVLESRRNLFDAQTTYARSRYDYIVNLLRLKIATGNLSEADLQEVNGWLTR